MPGVDQDQEVSERVSVSMSGGGNITISGLSQDEIDKIRTVVETGTLWAAITDGRFVFRPRFKPLPDPKDDDEMLPHWSGPAPGQGVQIALRTIIAGEDGLHNSDSPSIIISSLCGYNYTPDNYRKQSAILESFGFVAMRSRRGDNGRFWETWYLPGLWSATGALNDVVGDIPRGKKSVDDAIKFLCRAAEFGTLDICVRRAVMTMD